MQSINYGEKKEIYGELKIARIIADNLRLNTTS